MAALADVTDIEVALGEPPADATETARWQRYIDSVSAFINSYVDDSVDGEYDDDEVRYQADYYGVIQLGGGPVSSVSSVRNPRTDAEITRAVWDDWEEIHGLQPLETVIVTYTHGYEDVPEDVKAVVVDAVIDVLGLGANGPLKSLTVGDVTEAYQTDRGGLAVRLNEITLDRYRNTERTWRAGSGRYDNEINPQLPTL